MNHTRPHGKMEKHLTMTAGHSESDLLMNSGSCRQIEDEKLSLHPLSASLLSEQQKLKQVLDWAQTFLSRGSDVHYEFCRAESLMLAEEKKEQSQECKHLSADTYHYYHGSSRGGGAYEGEEDVKIHKPLAFTLLKDEDTQQENVQSMKLLDSKDKQTQSHNSRRTCSTKDLIFSRNDACDKMIDTRREKQRQQVEVKFEEKMEKKTEETKQVRMVGKEQKKNEHELRREKRNLIDNEPERMQEPKEKTSTLSGLNIPQSLTVYEQYKLCVNQLQHLRVRKHDKAGCCIKVPAREGETSKELAANPETSEPHDHFGSKRIRATDKHTQEGRLNVINEPKYNEKRNTLIEHQQAEHCDICRNKCDKSKKEEKTLIDYLIHTYEGLQRPYDDKSGAAVMEEHAAVMEEHAASISKPGLMPKRTRKNLHGKLFNRGIKGSKKKAEGQGALLRHCEKPHFSRVKRCPNRPTQSENIQPPTVFKDLQKCLLQDQTHSCDPGSAVAPWCCEQTVCKYTPAGVAVRAGLLSLPDEVWLSVLCLLSVTDLFRVMKVCRRLNTLAADHTLWTNVRTENSSLTDGWFLSVGGRRPHSLSLYSCSGPSLSPSVLEKFFIMCRNSLKALQVASCTGPGLQGDQILSLIGQLCISVSSVDVSWSGATDTGVNALSENCPRLRLKSVILNGCQLTDHALIKLVMRHKESLCRLEMFGCQFITSSCLQTVFEKCPGLQHLNIGQVPKVNTDCLTLMTSQLKCLISLNLTGLQAVSDASVELLLQSFIKLQRLTLSSCSAVTDQTMKNISEYTPYIRDLDVSGCKAVTDAGVQFLALGCQRLQKIDLSSTSTGNRGVSLLANYCSRHLQTVKLSFCPISSENILRLCRSCKRLKVLHLYGCARLLYETDVRQVNTAVTVYPRQSLSNTTQQILTT